MATYRSYKWVSADSQKAINVDPSVKDSVFGTVSRQPCNLISIFGRARQGKSFLMNCLAGERDIFKISNEKDSCTQGIDISNKWLNLNDFSKIDGGKIVSGRGIKVGFVDAEGQGDKDVSYDANLICPILLTSKCVIFNWKGDLQKDHMLSTLGIMARAASNISNSTSNSSGKASNSAKFGHLHIIFRDWQAIDSDEDSVERALLGFEGTTEAAMRDKIRKDLFASFQSIRVWLFETPVDYVQDLRQKLTFEKTNKAFRAQLRQLRGALADQLIEPTCVAGTDGVVLTGKAYGPLTAQIANALNQGRVVLPSSAYLGMMRDEADKIHQEYEEELTRNMNQLLASMDDLTVHLPTSNKSGVQVYASESVAINIWNESLEAMTTEYEKKKSEVFGEIVSGAVTNLLNDLNSQVVRVNEATKQQYLALYSRQFGKWLIKERQRAENYLDSKLNTVENEINSANYSERDVRSNAGGSGCQWPICEAELAELLTNVLQYAIEMIGGDKCYPHNNEVLDAVNILSRHFHASESRIKQAHDELIERGRDKANECLERAKRMIDIYLQESMENMKREHQNGYSITALEEKLNRKYFGLKKELDEQLLPKFSAHAKSVHQQFDDHCMELRDKMLAIYSNAKDTALQQLLNSLEEKVLAGPFKEIPGMLEQQAIEIYHGSKDELYRNDAMELLPVMLPPLREGAVQTALKYVQGWMLQSNEDCRDGRSEDPDELNELDRLMLKEEQFVEELRRMVEQAFDNFQAQLLSSLPEEPDVEMEEDDYQYDEDVMEDDTEELPKPPVKTVGSGGSLSVAEQKRLAREWACSNLGLKKVGRKNERLVSTNPRSRTALSNGSGIKRGKNSSVATPAKSLEQQRKAALEFAIQQFGPDIAFSPPTDTASRRNSLRAKYSQENSDKSSGDKRSSSDVSLDDNGECNNPSKRRQPFRQSMGESSGFSSIHSEERKDERKFSSGGSFMDWFVPTHSSEAVKSPAARKSDTNVSSSEKENSSSRQSSTPVKKVSAVALAKIEAKKRQEERANAAAERLKQKKLQKNK